MLDLGKFVRGSAKNGEVDAVESSIGTGGDLPSPVLADGGHADSVALGGGQANQVGQMRVECGFPAGEVEFSEAHVLTQLLQGVGEVLIGRDRCGQEGGTVGGDVDRGPSGITGSEERHGAS